MKKYVLLRETEGGGITCQLNKISDKYGLLANGQHTLGKRNLVLGIAEDFHMKISTLMSIAFIHR